MLGELFGWGTRRSRFCSDVGVRVRFQLVQCFQFEF